MFFIYPENYSSAQFIQYIIKLTIPEDVVIPPIIVNITVIGFGGVINGNIINSVTIPIIKTDKHTLNFIGIFIINSFIIFFILQTFFS